MANKKSKTAVASGVREERLPPVKWIEKPPTTSGNRTWETMDGMLRLVAVDQYHGIPMKLRWQLWRWKGKDWKPVAELRSRAKIDKKARLVVAEMDEDEGEE